MTDTDTDDNIYGVAGLEEDDKTMAVICVAIDHSICKHFKIFVRIGRQTVENGDESRIDEDVKFVCTGDKKSTMWNLGIMGSQKDL